MQIPAATTVVITALGIPQLPPAPPASGVTVFPNYVLGRDYFAALELAAIEWNKLTTADKSDPHNQLKIIGWKGWDGSIILNQLFGAIIECSASGTGAFG